MGYNPTSLLKSREGFNFLYDFFFSPPENIDFTGFTQQGSIWVFNAFSL